MTTRPVSVRLRANVDDYVRGMRRAQQATGGLLRDIDTTNDRTAWMAQGFLALAPAATTMGAAVVPVFAGLVTQMTLAAGAAGVLAVGFNGVGDGLKALNDYQLEPTAENLAKLNESMAKIGPDGEHFVRFLDSLGPQLASLANEARAGMFPGMEAGITSLMTKLPKFRKIVGEIAKGIGDLAAGGGEALAGPRFQEFFNYLNREARPLLVEMGQTIGNFIEGLANMMVAFEPLTLRFSAGFKGMSRDFADWAAGLDSSSTFGEFVTYVNQSIPKVLDLLGSVSDAFVQLTEASAPVGAVMVPLLARLFDMIALIADTPLGPVFIAAGAGMAIFGRSVALLSITTGGLTTQLGKAMLAGSGLKTVLSGGIPTMRQFGNTMLHSMHSQAQLNTYFKDGAKQAIASRAAVLGFTRAIAPGAVAAGAMAFSMSGLAEKTGTSNAALGLMLGTVGGPWGMAIGAGAGYALDLAHANDDLANAVDRANDAMKTNDIGLMQQRLAELNAEAEKGQGWLWDLSDFFGNTDSEADKAAIAIAGLETNIQSLKRELRGPMIAGDGLANLLGGPLGEVDRSFELATMSVRDFSNEVERLNGILSGRAELRDYEAAIDAVTEALKENGKTLDIGTEAGRANQEVLDNIAATSLRYADGMKAAQRVNFLRDARKDFIDAGVAFGMTQKAAARLANELGLLGKTKVNPPKVDIDEKPAREKLTKLERAMRAWERGNYQAALRIMDGEAYSAIDRLKMALKRIQDEEVFVHVRRSGTVSPIELGGGADGMTVPKTGLPYADRFLAMVADGEEIISNRHGQADRYRRDQALGHIPRYADGGTAGIGTAASQQRRSRGEGLSSSDRLAIAQAIAGIVDLKRQLAADGKDKLGPLKRRVVELELQVAKEELKLAKNRETREVRAALKGFNLDSIVPDPRDSTIGGRTQIEIQALKASIADAGGTWTRAMQRWARNMVQTANALDRNQAALERETRKRDDLQKTLDEQQAALDELNSTMASYADSVASNFLRNPFGQAQSATGGSSAGQSAELTAAEAQLAAIRNSPTGDSVAAAAAASQLIAQIRAMREQADAANNVGDSSQGAVTGLQALHNILVADTEAANQMAAALAELQAKGLDTSGAFGGLYASLAASGDLATAQELAALSAEQIDEYEKLFKTREDAAAAVAAMATQAVYSAEHAQLVAQVTASNALMVQQNAVLAALAAVNTRLENRLRAQADNGEALLDETKKLTHKVEDLPRKLVEAARKGL